MYLKKGQKRRLPGIRECADAAGRMKKRAGVVQLAVWTLLILVQMTTVAMLEVRAETETVQVQQEVRYENVEGSGKIPQQIEILVQEDGFETTAIGDLKEVAEEAVSWQDGFVLPVVFHVYGADVYMLDGQEIPADHEKPRLDGQEEKLLEAAGLSPEEYRIDAVRWDGGPYTDEAGELCRNVVATGRKLVRTFRARYAGTAVIPTPQTSGRMILENRAPEETETEQTEESLQETAPTENEVSVISESGGELTESQDQAGPELWQRITRIFLITVGIGAILFFLGIAVLAGLRIAKIVHLWYNRGHDNEDRD